MGPIIIAAVAILAAMAMRKKPDTVASSTSTAGSPYRKFVPTGGGGQNMFAGLAECFAGLDPAAQQQLAAVLKDRSVTLATLLQMSRGHAEAGLHAQAACLYGVAKERLLACAPTSGVAMFMENAINAPNVSPAALEDAARKLESNVNPPGTGAAKCLRDFSAGLFPGAAGQGAGGQSATGGQAQPVGEQPPAWLMKLTGG